MTRYCVFGAGSIGCYIGGRLAAAGEQVSFVGRGSIVDEVAEHGLRLSSLNGPTVEASDVEIGTDPQRAADADIVFVSVKSAATADAGATLARVVVRPDTVVISLQNGIGNDDVLRSALSDNTVLPGMVLFNVVRRGNGAFHQGTSGEVAVRDHPVTVDLAATFRSAGLELDRYPDLLPVQWAKLLLNLNNPINALSGLPLRDELSQRDFRRCLALAQREAIALTRAADIEPARLTSVPPQLMVRLLTAPDVLFRLLAGRVLAIDPHARSSMADDLVAGRATEIDWISGEVVRLAQRTGGSAPVNRQLMELVRDAERGGRRDWTGHDLLEQLRGPR